MTAFLIKFSLSLFVFLLFYKLFLEREKMHQVNRFLLLFALVFSLVIPFVSVEITSENSFAEQVIPSYVIPEIYIGNQSQQPLNFFTFENILWSIYWFGFSVFLVRFIRNLASLLRNIHESEKIKKCGFTLVLIPEKILPYSFWNYVFANKDEYENNLIDRELFVHEKAHITQKHSLDILFVEVLYLVFWFHPLIYFYKKAMKLNHEFLADQKVNETFDEVVNYQKLLLQKAVGNTLIPIASNLNYSITKKRFIMMTKEKSNIRVTVKVLFTVVVFLILFVSCSEKTKVQDNEEEIIENIENQGDVENQDRVYTVVEVFPEFEGGIDEFRKYVKDNLKLPKIQNDVKGKVWTQFIVEPDGSLSNVNIIRDLEGIGKEVIKLLENCPKWKSGYQNGKAVRVQYTLPIDVNLTVKK